MSAQPTADRVRDEAATISLIVCTYKRPLQVARLLQTVSQQTRLPDEVLIIDGSPDRQTEETVAACRSDASAVRSDREPTLVYHRVDDRDRGLTRQRNFGIERAGGAIIAFLDDDTVLEPQYLEAIVDCFERHPEAAGVGGYISNEVEWTRTGTRTSSLDRFCWEGWERREDYRWRVRRVLGLAPACPPGSIPPSGHGRPVGFLPPDGNDYQVEFFMGGASAWRREVFDRRRFSLYFDGYGLYEDLDFCLRVSREHPLYVCTRARLEHHHAATGRPAAFQYGAMVVRNGWYVWRRRWATPAWADRLRWWTVTVLLTASRAWDSLRGPDRDHAALEALGRLWGIGLVLLNPPVRANADEC